MKLGWGGGDGRAVDGTILRIHPGPYFNKLFTYSAGHKMVQELINLFFLASPGSSHDQMSPYFID